MFAFFSFFSYMSLLSLEGDGSLCMTALSPTDSTGEIKKKKSDHVLLYALKHYEQQTINY